MRLASRRLGVALDHQLLDRDRAFDRGDDRGEFQQQPVAHRLDDAAAERGDDRPRRLAMLAHALRRPRFVLAHEARVADDVDGEDRGEAAGCGHGGEPITDRHPAMRDPGRGAGDGAVGRRIGASLRASRRRTLFPSGKLEFVLVCVCCSQKRRRREWRGHRQCYSRSWSVGFASGFAFAAQEKCVERPLAGR